MRGGPGARTPENGGMKKHNRWTCKVSGCCSAAPAGRPGAWKFSKIRRPADQIRVRVRTNFLSWLTWVNSKSLSIHEFDLPVTNFKVSSVRPVTEFFVRRQLYNLPTRRCKISDVPRAGVPSPGVRRDVRRSEQWTLHAQYAYGATFGMEEVYIIYLELRINKIKEKGRNKENNYYWSKIFFDPGQPLHPSLNFNSILEYIRNR